MQFLVQVLIFLVTVLILVTVHEFGHFWVAKRLGVKVLRFSVGFGKAIWRRMGKDGTEYVIAFLPLGGYVKLLDEGEGPVADSEKHLAFNRKPVWKRVVIVAAGPAINVLFAILAFWIMFMIGVMQLKPIIGEVTPDSIAAKSGLAAGLKIVQVDTHTADSWEKIVMALVRRLGDTGELMIKTQSPQDSATQSYDLQLNHWSINGLNPDPLESLGIVPYHPVIPPVFDKIDANGPAARAGLQKGDQVVAVDGHAVKDWVDFVKYIKVRPHQRVSLKIMRAGQPIIVDLEVARHLQGLKWVGYLGVASTHVTWPPEMRTMVQLNPGAALVRSVEDVWSFTTFNFIVLGKMLTGEISLQSLGGPIAIFQSAERAFQQGLVIYIGFLGLISVMLAFVNILPIPGLDGGHILFFLIESVIRRPISQAVQVLILRLGLIFLVLIILQATLNDLMRSF